MIVRYKETPVGPYDEVIWMPGYFEVPGTGRKHARITRIYVSSLESVFNGGFSFGSEGRMVCCVCADGQFRTEELEYPEAGMPSNSTPINTRT